ncbi:MAG: hypothetical protein M1325_00990 [Actinobacteria bacterium]|nr:hypothetical protein [Actinomycetota bacterium]
MAVTVRKPFGLKASLSPAESGELIRAVSSLPRLGKEPPRMPREEFSVEWLDENGGRVVYHGVPGLLWLDDGALFVDGDSAVSRLVMRELVKTGPVADFLAGARLWLGAEDLDSPPVQLTGDEADGVSRWIRESRPVPEGESFPHTDFPGLWLSAGGPGSGAPMEVRLAGEDIAIVGFEGGSLVLRAPGELIAFAARRLGPGELKFPPLAEAYRAVELVALTPSGERMPTRERYRIVAVTRALALGATPAEAAVDPGLAGEPLRLAFTTSAGAALTVDVYERWFVLDGRWYRSDGARGNVYNILGATGP